MIAVEHFLDIPDAVTCAQLIESARSLKADPFRYRKSGRGRSAVLLFMNPSLRTRLSTERAARNLGLDCTVLNAGSDAWRLEYRDGAVMDGDRAEHIKEAAGVISSYADIIGLRAFAGLEDRETDYAEPVLNAFAEHATVPLVNMESATAHPLQALTDLMTIRETSTAERPRIALTWAPHPKALPQAVANSFVRIMVRNGADVVVTHPPGYELDPECTQGAEVTHDQQAALDGADFVYAKNWSSWSDYGSVISRDPEWMVTTAKMARTRGAKFMHCLPVRRNVVVAEEVIDSADSIVLEQAANRTWAAQAVMRALLEG